MSIPHILFATAQSKLDPKHRKRIKTERKPKVVAEVWGTEFIQFLATLDIYHHDDFEDKDE